MNKFFQAHVIPLNTALCYFTSSKFLLLAHKHMCVRSFIHMHRKIGVLIERALFLQIFDLKSDAGVLFLHSGSKGCSYFFHKSLLLWGEPPCLLLILLPFHTFLRSETAPEVSACACAHTHMCTHTCSHAYTYQCTHKRMQMHTQIKKFLDEKVGVTLNQPKYLAYHVAQRS